MTDKIAFIGVHITAQEGMFMASSPDLPGLFVCGKSVQDVKADVGPMIERLYKLNQGIEVRAALDVAHSPA